MTKPSTKTVQNEVAPVSKARVARVDIRTNIGKVAGGTRNYYSFHDRIQVIPHERGAKEVTLVATNGLLAVATFAKGESDDVLYMPASMAKPVPAKLYKCLKGDETMTTKYIGGRWEDEQRGEFGRVKVDKYPVVDETVIKEVNAQTHHVIAVNPKQLVLAAEAMGSEYIALIVPKDKGNGWCGIMPLQSNKKTPEQAFGAIMEVRHDPANVIKDYNENRKKYLDSRNRALKSPKSEAKQTGEKPCLQNQG